MSRPWSMTYKCFYLFQYNAMKMKDDVLTTLPSLCFFWWTTFRIVLSSIALFSTTHRVISLNIVKLHAIASLNGTSPRSFIWTISGCLKWLFNCVPPPFSLPDTWDLYLSCWISTKYRCLRGIAILNRGRRRHGDGARCSHSGKLRLHRKRTTQGTT